ncbi:hypothetical protein TSMEX_009890, partial [Taenia solium]
PNRLRRLETLCLHISSPRVAPSLNAMKLPRFCFFHKTEFNFSPNEMSMRMLVRYGRGFFVADDVFFYKVKELLS